MELAVQHGIPVLLQNVHEKLDPSLDPVLNKSIIKIGKLFFCSCQSGLAFHVTLTYYINRLFMLQFFVFRMYL